jgi:magnesium chelatase subunit D
MEDTTMQNRCDDALLVMLLLQLDGQHLGGVHLRCRDAELSQRWLHLYRQGLPPSAPWRRMPLQISDERLLGGMDLEVSLQQGQAVYARGLLAEVHQGHLQINMAERMPPALSARLCAVLDQHQVNVNRDGVHAIEPSDFTVIAVDEGEEDEHIPDDLLDRLGFTLRLDRLRGLLDAESEISVQDIQTLRAQLDGKLAQLSISDDTLRALCGTAMALGLHSLRSSQQAVRVACLLAVLEDADEVTSEHASRAAQLVLAPRARQLPVSEEQPEPEAEEQPQQAQDQEDPQQQESEPEPQQPQDQQQDTDTGMDEMPEELVLAAAAAAIPEQLLDKLQLQMQQRRKPSGSQGSGGLQKGAQRGRPVGIGLAHNVARQRLHIPSTLKAAAPWQQLRRKTMTRPGEQSRLRIMPDDFRVQRFQQQRETTTVFVVDASGSQAAQRLAEAKGAVELLLADCYVRRDSVALIAFRGSSAELMLPPTRSLVRAKRTLAALPGGGGTPIATGLQAAAELAGSLQKRGQHVVIVVLTDGRANIGLDGQPGREQARTDAHVCARQLASLGCSSLLVDTSARARDEGKQLAEQLQAMYLLLPRVEAQRLSAAVMQVAA